MGTTIFLGQLVEYVCMHTCTTTTAKNYLLFYFCIDIAGWWWRGQKPTAKYFIAIFIYYYLPTTPMQTRKQAHTIHSHLTFSLSILIKVCIQYLLLAIIFLRWRNLGEEPPGSFLQKQFITLWCNFWHKIFQQLSPHDFCTKLCYSLPITLKLCQKKCTEKGGRGMESQ